MAAPPVVSRATSTSRHTPRTATSGSNTPAPTRPFKPTPPAAPPPMSGPASSTSPRTSSTSQYPACKIGTPPDESVPSGYTKVEFRWPWNHPTNPATAYPGSGCPLNFASTMGFTVPPYPSSLSVTGLSCPMDAVLEFQDGQCPWYYVIIPNSDSPTSGTARAISLHLPGQLQEPLHHTSAALPVIQSERVLDRIYAGAPTTPSPP